MEIKASATATDAINVSLGASFGGMEGLKMIEA
jgi:hypothetical protein